MGDVMGCSMRAVARAWALPGVLAAALTVAALTPASTLAAGNAAYTTFNPEVGGCLHNSGVNCNIYEAKKDVYINGGPSGGKGLANGEYFFAVLAPGCQNGGFLDGAKGNLSDETPGHTASGWNDKG